MNKVYRVWICFLAGVAMEGLVCDMIRYVIEIREYENFGEYILGNGGNLFYIWLLFLGISLWITTRQYNIPPMLLVIFVEATVFIGYWPVILLWGIWLRLDKSKEKAASTDDHGAVAQKQTYILVLGAKVNGNKPSRLLQNRIYAAAQYWKNHRDFVLIACGGQGPDEQVSEARCIGEELLRQGVESNKLRYEEQSTTTRENIQYALRMMREEGGGVDNPIVLVSTDFHLPRARWIARSMGCTCLQTVAGASLWWLIPTNYTRECVAMVKDRLLEKIRKK